MALQINLAQVREKYPELIPAFQAIQQAMNAPVAATTSAATTVPGK